jgi:hypothetical protein
MEVKCTILDVMHQDGPYDLLAPSFNLTLCRTNSSGVYGKLKSMAVRLASNTIYNILFMVLVLGYSIEPQHNLDHIWQSYADADGKTVELSAQIHYTSFMNTIHSFYDLEEYLINLARVFQDHIDPSMQKSFHAHYSNFGATSLRAAITQHSILTEMLNALIKAKNNLTNIQDIVHVEQCGGEQFATFQAMPSVAEKTLWWCPDNGTSKISQDLRGSYRNDCFGCSGLLPPPTRCQSPRSYPSALKSSFRTSPRMEMKPPF